MTAMRPRAPQVTRGHYAGFHYHCKQRLASMWHQVDEVLRFEPREVLEVGVGSGFTTRMLTESGVAVTTADIAVDLEPNLVAGGTDLPLPDGSVDVSLCSQVLEHLPFAELGGGLRELWRVSRRGLVVSLPDRGRFVGFSLFTLHRRFGRIVDVPRRIARRPQRIDEQHHWEIGARDVTLGRVVQEFRWVTGAAPRTYRVPEHPWHRFFIVERCP